MQIEFNVLENFAPLWTTKKRYAVCMGGRGAGRSTAASQFALSKLPAKEYMRCAIMRAVSSDIRHSIWREISDRIDEQGVKELFHIRDNDMNIEYGDNSLQAHGFRASSGSHSAKLKSLANYNTVIVEEAEEIGEEEFMKLDDTLRTVQGDIKIIFCLNPPPKNHWIIQRWFDLSESETKGFYIPKLKENSDAEYLFGTFEDNLNNLDKNTIQRYRNYEKIKPDYYYQMIRGLVPDVVRGKIYHGWELIEFIPKEARLIRYGIDFGWYPDPACLVAIYYLNGGYIIDELVCGTEITNEVLASYIHDKSVPVIADSAEPKSIDEIKRYGIQRIEGSEKGSDSVNYGIKVVSEKRISVTKRSVNVWKGYEVYAWDEDKDGNPKGKPAHNGSDPMDAIRYAITSLQTKSGSNVKINKPGQGYGQSGISVKVNIPTRRMY